MQWLDREIKVLLQTIDAKVDSLLVDVAQRPVAPRPAGPQRRRGSSDGPAPTGPPRRNSFLSQQPLFLGAPPLKKPSPRASLTEQGTLPGGLRSSITRKGAPKGLRSITLEEHHEVIDGGADSRKISESGVSRSMEETLFDADEDEEQRARRRQETDHPLAKRSQRPISETRRLTQLLDFQDRVAGRNKYRHACVDEIWHFLEEPESSKTATRYAHGMITLICLSVGVALLQTGSPPPLKGVLPAVLDLTFDFLFMTEFLLRWVANPSPMRYIVSLYNMIDATCFVSFGLRVALGVVLPEILVTSELSLEDHSQFFTTLLLAVLPVARLLKLIRRFEKFHLLFHAFEQALEALPVLLFTGALILSFAASVIFLCEPRWNLDSLPRAMWMSLVTMTTVGYGDYSPKGTAGTIVTSILVITSALYMAIPLGIVGSAFNNVWSERENLLLVQRTRRRLIQWNYSPSDIATFFQLFSSRGNGALVWSDFQKMITEMKLGLSPQRVLALFNLFDDDDSGTVDPEEFVSKLFPNAVLELDESDEEMEDMEARDTTGGWFDGDEGFAQGQSAEDEPGSGGIAGAGTGLGRGVLSPFASAIAAATASGASAASAASGSALSRDVSRDRDASREGGDGSAEEGARAPAMDTVCRVRHLKEGTTSGSVVFI